MENLSGPVFIENPADYIGTHRYSATVVHDVCGKDGCAALTRSDESHRSLVHGGQLRRSASVERSSPVPERRREVSDPTDCPFCGRTNELHGDIQDATKRPNTGDVSLCWGCRQPAVFVAGPGGLSVRKPTADELAEILADERVREALGVMAESYTPTQALGMTRQRGAP